MLELPIYLDHNATTPCDPRVVEEMLPYFSRHFGNASSRQHAYGWHAAEAVTLARERVAQLIGANADDIIFTSGATESVNLAIKGIAERYASKGKHVITCVTEHKAVMDTCKHLEKQGMEVTYLPVSSDGLINVKDLEAAIRPDTILIAIMYANNETGTVMPVAEIGALARKHEVLFFTDATQAAGKIPVQVNKDQIDLLAFSAHKMYGPKGVGALYVRSQHPRVKLVAQMDGGGHEKGMRSGTLNVPAIVGFGKACEFGFHEMNQEAKRLSHLRDLLEHALVGLGEVNINGSTQCRLPHVSNVTFRCLEGEGLLMGFGKEVAVSSGAACTSASLEPSHVLKALGLDRNQALSSLRFSLGRSTTTEEIEYVIALVSKTLLTWRDKSPLWKHHQLNLEKDATDLVMGPVSSVFLESNQSS